MIFLMKVRNRKVDIKSFAVNYTTIQNHEKIYEISIIKILITLIDYLYIIFLIII